MPLHPQARAALESGVGQPRPYQQTVAEARAGYEARLKLVGPEMASIRDYPLKRADGSRFETRLYRPADGLLPLIVYCHGGGWVLGGLESHDGACRRLAAASGWAVLAVEYGLAPEHRYPIAAEDAYLALQWAVRDAGDVDPRKVAVAGDSAGGNIACAAALLARDRGGPDIARQVLVYPVTARRFDSPSYRDLGEGYGLTGEDMQWYWNHYIGGDAAAPYADLLQANLKGLPPALIVTAEYDVLRDDGAALAAKFRKAEVEVVYSCYAGAIHGFFSSAPPMDHGAQAVSQIAAFLNAPG